ncbi:MAG TPA: hypothetical protein VF595_18060 [Tepidisphaeraceae bacterium]|jgi:hypothetical protein
MARSATDDPLRPLGITRDDLAPADTRSADFDWTGLGVHFVETPGDKQFDTGYDALCNEFDAKGELETRDVLTRRLGWRPERLTSNGYALRYEMIVVRQGDTLAAVRDHTAIVDVRRPERACVVHLSHLLITPAWRGSGLAGWMRALPMYTARECLTRAAQPPRPITLVAEMEPADPTEPGNIGRLVAYGKVGFLKVDPTRVNYLQPDFRSPDAIDTAGGPRPLPLSLVVRRVGRENETQIAGAELRALVESLYAMYGESFRAEDMRPNWESLNNYPPDDARIDLVKPSSIPTRGTMG